MLHAAGSESMSSFDKFRAVEQGRRTTMFVAFTTYRVFMCLKYHDSLPYVDYFTLLYLATAYRSGAPKIRGKVEVKTSISLK